MTEPQVWTLIGVFTAVMLGGMTLMTTLLMHTMNAKFDAVDAKFEKVYAKLDHLDRDVQAVTRHIFGPDRN